MKPHERLDYLIRALAGNNARAFASKAGIRPDSLSRARHGITNPSAYFERVLGAFPCVSRAWLYDGEGEPMVEDREKGEILAKLERLEAEVARLADLVESFSKSFSQ